MTSRPSYGRVGRRDASRVPTAIGLRQSLHSSDAIVFEDTTASLGSFGGSLDGGQQPRIPPPTDGTNISKNVSKNKQVQIGLGRSSPSKKDVVWYSLSTSSISDLSSVQSVKRKRKLPRPIAASTRNNLRREKEADLKSKFKSINMTDRESLKENECDSNDKNEDLDNQLLPSSTRHMSTTEQEAREREATLIRRLENFHSSNNEKRAEGSKTPIDKNPEDTFGKERYKKINATNVKHNPSSFIRKDARDGIGSAAVSMTRQEVEARMMVEKLERKLQRMDHRDKSAQSSLKAERESKVDSIRKDEIGAFGIMKSIESPEIMPPSDREHNGPRKQRSETQDRAAMKEKYAKTTLLEEESGEESTRALHVQEDEEEDDAEVSTNPLPYNSQFQSSKRQKSRYNEGPRSGRISIVENPRKGNEQEIVKAHGSLVDKALERFKAALAAGIPETDSLLERCLNEVLREQGDWSRLEDGKDEVIPKEILIQNEDDVDQSMFTENESHHSDEEYGNKEIGTDSEESHKRAVVEFKSFPDAAPVPGDRKLKSTEKKRKPRTRRSGDESRSSKKSDYSSARRAEKQVVPVPAVESLDLESGVVHDDGQKDSVMEITIDDSGIKSSLNSADEATQEGRKMKRMMIAISTILFVAFVIILIVVFDPLRRLWN